MLETETLLKLETELDRLADLAEYKKSNTKGIEALREKILADLKQYTADSDHNKAIPLYVRGRVLNAIAADAYDAEAEQCLSKAVKLEPSLVSAWNDLGMCFWKKQDYSSAYNCFQAGVNVKPNVTSFRHLSMLVRVIKTIPGSEKKGGSGEPTGGVGGSANGAGQGGGGGGGSGVSQPGGGSSSQSSERGSNNSQEAVAEYLQQSVTYAKNAVNLNMQDAKSWYVLGNAYLFQFFGTTQDDGLLGMALKAYHKSQALSEQKPAATGAAAENKEREGSLQTRNPDLFFNRATIHKFFEDFHLAVDDYQVAQSLDPSLNSGVEVENIVRFVSKVSKLVKSKNGIKPKRLTALLAAHLPSREKMGAILEGSATATTATTTTTTLTMDAASGSGNSVEGTSSSEQKFWQPVNVLDLHVVSQATKEKEKKNGSRQLLTCLLLAPIKRPDDALVSFLLSDAAGTTFMLSVYNVATKVLDGVRVNDVIGIADPVLKHISLPSSFSSSLSHEGNAASLGYPCIQVKNPNHVFVNGTPLARSVKVSNNITSSVK